MTSQVLFRVSIVPLVLLLGSSLASAQATRTWVSGVGDDVNPCSRTAPCKTFAGAISKTAAGGEISVLDPGGFGAVTCTKSICINGGGIEGSILSSLTNGVNVNDSASATPNTIVVTLRNIEIFGGGNGIDGIRFSSGKELYVENCQIYSVTQQGIDFVPATGNGATKLFVRDTIIRKCATGGIQMTPVSPSTVNAVLDNVRLDGNSFGCQPNDRVSVSLRNCSLSGNTSQGLVAFSNAGGPVEANLESCLVGNNGSIGIRANAATVNVRLSNVTIVDNIGASIDVTGGGVVTSFVNNRIKGNGTDILPTANEPGTATVAR